MENKTEIKLIKYDFTSIINDKQCAKSLYIQAYKHFSLNKNDETYFADIFDILGNGSHFKLSKKYNKNNIAVLPIHYDNDTKKFNTSNDLIIDNFLTPIVSRLMSIIFNDNFKINLPYPFFLSLGSIPYPI